MRRTAVFVRWSMTIVFAVIDCSSLLSVETCLTSHQEGPRIRGKNKWPPTLSLNDASSILSAAFNDSPASSSWFYFPPWLSSAALRGEPTFFRGIMRFSFHEREFRGREPFPTVKRWIRIGETSRSLRTINVGIISEAI